VVGRRSFSIRTMLWLAVCVSLVCAGYTQGLNRFQIRQRMIAEVRDAGGQIKVVDWGSHPDAVRLPAMVSGWLGEGYGGYVRDMVVPSGQFTADNLRRWSLREVENLTVRYPPGTSQAVDLEVLRAIPPDGRLKQLHFWSARLTPPALSRLAEQRMLQHLAFDCQGQSIPETFVEIPALESAELHRVRLDTSSMRVLAESTALEFLTLTAPVFTPDVTADQTPRPQFLSIRSATITPDGLRTLCRFGDSALVLNGNCRIDSPVAVPDATLDGLYFSGGNLNDKMLSRIGSLGNIRWVTLVRTAVTHDGFEAFSERHPRQYVHWRK